MKSEAIPASFFVENRKKLISLLEDKSLALIFANDKMPRTGDQYFSYRQNSNMYYMSGIDYPDSILALCPQHSNAKCREILFIEQPTQQKIIKEGCEYTQKNIRDISGVQTVLFLSDFENILRELMYYSDNVYADIQQDIKFAPNVKPQGFRYINKIKSDYPLHNYCNLFPIISDMRMVKSSYELEQIKNACDITEKTFKRLINFIKPNVWEYEIEAEIVHEFIRNQSVCAFHTIVASGVNACTLHYNKNNSLCKDGDLLLLDFGAEYGNYASDLSRTVPINGRFTERQKQIYDACFRVYEYAKTLFIPSMSINKIHKKIFPLMQEELINLGLFSHEDLEKQSSEYELMKKYFMHKISHFIGLDVHDVGTTDTVFETGMILSCEPAIYIPQEKNRGTHRNNDDSFRPTC